MSSLGVKCATATRFLSLNARRVPFALHPPADVVILPSGIVSFFYPAL